MTNELRPDLKVVEHRVCDVASEYLDIPRTDVQPTSRLIEDLNCDSLDLVELMMKLEDEFLVTIPNDPANPVGKSIFTRQPFRLSDLAEIIYLQHGTGKPERKGWGRRIVADSDAATIPFSQLSGCWKPSGTTLALFEPLGSGHGNGQFRRRTDGMRCVLLPSTEIEIGNAGAESQPDERPVHKIQIDAFMIDAEFVSTTAYCRFLNSIQATDTQLLDWILLDAEDDRIHQMPIMHSDDEWRPVSGVETLPMVLVSWYGANAYSLWANGSQWDEYRTRSDFLPSEAQWEYAAQGAFPETSEHESKQAQIVAGQHERGVCYETNTMPMASVHSPIGVSTRGLYHMAGNVWQWCRDWYDKDFYQRPESLENNPVNNIDSGVRSERGGSWVGPIELCRPSYRRGRAPAARGRCLGFRCISSAKCVSNS